MRFVHGAALSAAIQDIVAEQPADMAVAFWGNGACDRLKMPRKAKGSRVVCDARSGSCNPSALADLLSRNVDIRDVPRLHAKVYIGREGVVVTSANASANGLGEEEDEVSDALEAGYLSERPEDIKTSRQWFEAV